MTMVYMFLLTFLAIVTKKRKFLINACKKTPSSPENDSISPSNERNEEFEVREDALTRVIGCYTRERCFFGKKSYKEA